MTVYRKNITINVGETFSEDLTLLSADGSGVVDLTGFTAQSQLRKHPSNPRFADIQVGIVNANKNQKFSIDLSKKLIHKKIMFHFIGNDTMIENSGVSYDDFELPNIKYWGERYDVDNFMSCMDLFLFPSYRELNPLAVKQAL